MKKYTILIIIIILIAGSVSGYLIWQSRNLKKLENQQAVSIAELLKNPVYDELVKIYGEVSYLGEVNRFREVPDCPCFSLYSEGAAVNVWHDSIDVKGIKNGERAVVIGELKSESKDKEFKDFWARKIEKIK